MTGGELAFSRPEFPGLDVDQPDQPADEKDGEQEGGQSGDQKGIHRAAELRWGRRRDGGRGMAVSGR